MTKETQTRAAYKFHRQAGKAPAVALARARDDSAAGKSRYPQTMPNRPAYQTRDKSSRSRETLVYLDPPESFGLRHIGDVAAESGRYDSGSWQRSGRRSGWYTNPYGESSPDGSGLCWGVVYQLPARGGRARFVAGYTFGDCDGGPTLDLSTIYESAPGDNCRYSGPADNFAARDAARAADSMAAGAAEREREYQTAWQLGAAWRDAADSIPDLKSKARELLRERRQAKRAGADLPAICAAIRESVSGILSEISDARDVMRKALDGESGDLSVYMDSQAKGAFIEAAGLETFPA